jgi:serine/threonine protein kinase
LLVRFSAFDNEKCTEGIFAPFFFFFFFFQKVVWIEYRDVPRSVMEKFDDMVGSLIALDHPNLVKYHAGWVDRKNRTLVFITEQVTADLRNWFVKKIEMASKVYVRWMRQLCQGLDYLHKNNFLHADLNASKIFVRGTGELKIGGLAEIFFADVSFSDKDFHVGIGAPELILETKLSPMQNVYQLGLCALQGLDKKNGNFMFDTIVEFLLVNIHIAGCFCLKLSRLNWRTCFLLS